MNNPDFVNPTNPDALLYVEFYWHEPVDKWASEVKSAEAGKRVTVKGPKTAFVRIMRPGDQTTIIETAVEERHKQRFPEKWLYWQMAEGVIEDQKVPGWQMDEWTYLDDKPDLLRDLKHARFQTVDQLAGASDGQVQKLGIGGLGLREQARVDLRNRMGKEMASDMAKKDAEIEALKKADQEKEERLKRLEEALMRQAAPQELQPSPVATQPADAAPRLKRKYVRKAQPHA